MGTGHDVRLPFSDREEAGALLAARLYGMGLEDPVVLALPRGGVAVAVPIAERLGCPLDVLVTRKLGYPEQPELGVGAIAEGGEPVFDRLLLYRLGLTEQDLDDVLDYERGELARRVEVYRGARPLIDLAGRDAVIVDDGLATGSTARAAVDAVRTRRPRTLILAVPVGATDTVRSLRAALTQGSAGPGDVGPAPTTRPAEPAAGRAGPEEIRGTDTGAVRPEPTETREPPAEARRADAPPSFRPASVETRGTSGDARQAGTAPSFRPGNGEARGASRDARGADTAPSFRPGSAEGGMDVSGGAPRPATDTAGGVARRGAVADEVVVLATPRRFHAVGEWYVEFDQLTDADVLRLLRRLG
jgi:putative phosphoribosyl transferase